MNGMNKDTGAMRKVLLGAVAAGSGLALYYGFTRWKSRPDGGKPAVLDLTEEPKTETSTEKSQAKAEITIPPAPRSPAPEPPLHTSTPGVSRASSTDTTLDPLSLSGSFEKVSLSALRENHDTTGDESLSGERSPSESFEKVSLPPVPKATAAKVPTSKDAPVGDLSDKTGKVSDVQKPDSNVRSSTAPVSKEPRVQFEEKILKEDSSSVQSTPKSAPVSQPTGPVPTRPIPEGKADPPRPSPEALSSDPKPPGDLPPPLQPKVMSPSQIPTLSKPAMPPPVAPKPLNKIPDPLAAQKTSQTAQDTPQPAEKTSPTSKAPPPPRDEEVDGSSEEEDEDDDEEGSDSDASGDSQVEMSRV